MLFRTKVLFICLVAVLGSCQSEQKWAEVYGSKSPKPALMLTRGADWQVNFNLPEGLTASESFARRYFPYRIYNFKNNGTGVADSLFFNSLNNSLIQSGFSVYDDTAANQFLQYTGQKFVVEFLQLWIEESGIPFRDTLFFDDGTYRSFDTVLTRFSISVWLRMNPVDDTLLASPVLYAEFEVSDAFYGMWEYNLSTDIHYFNYSHSPLNFDDALTLFQNAGHETATYMDDYFLNLFLFTHSQHKSDVYFTRSGKRIKAAGNRRFVFIKP